ncbi:MAG: ABC transporter ATP-binding protein [Planctomycetia bacterium]|nr:ABC transporter ATP-binding protein [Planctomycetia bacterium]
MHHAVGSSTLLSFEHVTKFYGPVIGINDVSCRVGPGITGLLGANGAGKSTLIKLASGQLRPTQGTVLIGQHQAWSTAAKHHLGYSPDLNSFYEEMTGREFVYTMARLHGFSRGEARQRTEYALEEVGMADRARRHLAGYSHGMRQRIKLAQTLVHDPWLLLLDEPLAGIDPGGRREISELLLKLAGQGKTLLISSHILVEIEQLSSSIIMMSRGRIVACGTIAEVRNLMQFRPLVVEIVAEPARRLAALLAENPDVQGVEVRDSVLIVRTRNPSKFFDQIGQLVCAHGIEVLRLQTLDGGADAVFEYLQQGRP